MIAVPPAVFALNIGSITTKVGFLCEGLPVVRETLPAEASLDDVSQIRKRHAAIEKFFHAHDIDPGTLAIIVSRGGLMNPGPSGIYRINQAMCDDLLGYTYGKHVSALGPPIAFEMARALNIEAVVVDPPSTDEFHDLARFTGIPSLTRTSAFHALNQKAAARKAALALGKTYAEINLVVAHLGGGITIGAHQKGRVIDATNGLSEGPFSPERAGSLPTRELLTYAREHPQANMNDLLTAHSGLYAYLGTKDAFAIEERIRNRDHFAEQVYLAMAYQISKEIGATAAALSGDVQAIVLTGGLAHSALVTAWIRQRVEFIAPVLVYPGEDEIAVLLESGLRVLNGEAVRSYPP